MDIKLSGSYVYIFFMMRNGLSLPARRGTIISLPDVSNDSSKTSSNPILRPDTIYTWDWTAKLIYSPTGELSEN